MSTKCGTIHTEDGCEIRRDLAKSQMKAKLTAMEQGRSVEITCPKCSKITDFNVTDAISCKHCKCSFSTLRLAVKITLLPTVGALAIGGAIGHQLDSFFEANRYPLEIEYALVESCVQGAKRSEYWRRAEQKFVLCSCALTYAQKNVNFKKFKEAPSQFSQAMTAAIQNCSAG